ncbi:hypothetical protein L7F22_063236 [Adiantum nelumboides]|nr:hypothetical protein [Adiantum nelumboides]
MAPLVGPHDERYEDFYSSWTRTQGALLKELEEAVGSDMKEIDLFQQVKKLSEHYETYYKAKEMASHQDILQTVTPDWRSPLEKAFLWLGGWRPSLAFQLVYALAGQQIEAELAEFLNGVDTPTFASLTSSQLSQISELQTATNKQEENLSNEMAVLQQSFSDQPLLSLAQAHCLVQAEEGKNGSQTSSSDEDDAAHGGDDHIGGGGDNGGSDGDNDDGLGNAVQEKLVSLQEIATQADALRLTTLKKVLDVLDTYQKAQYLIAAGKLQVALRDIGGKLNGTTGS